VGGCGVYKTITVTGSPAHTPGFAVASAMPAISDETSGRSASKSTPQNGITTLSEGTMNVYPNPTSGNLNIQWQNQETGNAAVIITDMTGREVYHSVLNITDVSGQDQVSLSDLKSGIYLISIKSDAVHFSSKLVIQH
jgi:hypothetical protein